MANTDRPSGLIPVSTPGCDSVVINGFAPLGYSIATGYATSLFVGTPVKLSGTSDTSGRPGIALCAAADNACIGVLVGVRYVDTTGITHGKYWPASTTATQIVADVSDHPFTLYSINCDESIAVTDIGETADWTAESGDTATGISTIELDSSDITTGEGLHIRGILPTPDNEFGTNAKALVTIREHAQFITSGKSLIV